MTCTYHRQLCIQKQTSRIVNSPRQLKYIGYIHTAYMPYRKDTHEYILVLYVIGPEA